MFGWQWLTREINQTFLKNGVENKRIISFSSSEMGLEIDICSFTVMMREERINNIVGAAKMRKILAIRQHTLSHHGLNGDAKKCDTKYSFSSSLFAASPFAEHCVVDQGVEDDARGDDGHPPLVPVELWYGFGSEDMPDEDRPGQRASF